MQKLNSTRITEVLVSGTWGEVHFGDLRMGDVFRLFESNGAVVIDPEGYTQWTVIGLPTPFIGPVPEDLFGIPLLVECEPYA